MKKILGIIWQMKINYLPDMNIIYNLFVIYKTIIIIIVIFHYTYNNDTGNTQEFSLSSN